ncbi:MAG: ABC transporter ATP-binding protein [Acidobacteria bacterium]|nr:ABC transporter ATP-binding protein [Acidobacteriota bacterium]
MIEADRLSCRFGRVRAVDGVSFAAAPGEVLGLLGPNGAGKTTLLRLIAGVLRPDAGTVRIDGVDAMARPAEARRRLGYLPEHLALPPELRVGEYLAFRAAMVDLPRSARSGAIADVLEACRLGDCSRALIGTLSRGYRQRIGLAGALLGAPPALVLDEPTAALDPHQAVETRALIRALAPGRAILFSSHLLAEVELSCDRVVILDRGRVAAEGTVGALLRGATAATTRVECRASDAPALREALEALGPPGSEVELGDGWCRLEYTAAGDLRETIGRAAAARGIALRELGLRLASLEQAFLAAIGPRADR